MGKVKIKPYQVIEGNLMAIKDTRDFGGSNMWHLHIATKRNYWESVQWMDVRTIQDFFTEKLPVYKEMADGGVMGDGGEVDSILSKIDKLVKENEDLSMYIKPIRYVIMEGFNEGDDISMIEYNVEKEMDYQLGLLLNENELQKRLRLVYAKIQDILYNADYFTLADGGVMAKGGVPRQRKYDDGGMMAKGGGINRFEIRKGKVIYTSATNFDEFKKEQRQNYSSIRMANARNSAMMSDWKIIEEQLKKMASGGLFDSPQKRSANRGRSWTLDHRQHNKGQSYETPLNKRKRKY